MICRICGKQNDDAAAFCTSCGNRMPFHEPPSQASPLWAGTVGAVLGAAIGLGMVGLLPYWHFFPFLVFGVLTYGLGLAVFLICVLWKGLFPARTKPHLTPFAIAFLVGYYVFSIGYLMYLVG